MKSQKKQGRGIPLRIRLPFEFCLPPDGVSVEINKDTLRAALPRNGE